MRTALRYGEGFLPLELSPRYVVESLTPRTIDEHRSAIDEVTRILEHPIDSESLSQIARRVETAAIVVNSEQDISVNRRLLDLLLCTLESSMTDSGDLTIIFSTGHLANMNSRDADLILGEPTSRGHHLLLHDPNDADALCFMGDTTMYSTPVSINRVFAETDIRIGIGTIRGDVFMGATGGRMSVMPHVCGAKTITRSTKLQAIHPIGFFETDTAACMDMEEISRIAGLDFILNAVPDWLGNLADITAGESFESWSHSLSIAKAMTEVPIQSKADIAIVSSGGEFSDSTLYAAVDSLNAAYEATEYGGTIVLVAECADGTGPEGFLKGVSECNSAAEVEIIAQTNFELGIEKARFFWNILESRNLIICSKLRESTVTERFHSQAVRDPQEGFELAKNQIVSKPRVAVIPQGNRTLPIPKAK